VALSLNVEPGEIAKNPDASTDAAFAESRDFDERLEILSRSFVWLKQDRTGAIRRVATGSISYDATIKAVEFATWARQRNWPMPKKLKALAEPRRPSAKRWPWGDYQTKKLSALAAAVGNFWAGYAPGKTPLHTNQGVAEWIREQYPNISRDLATNIARIIRPDDAPMGRPKTKRRG
jgi:hypothetical protein